MEKLIHYGKLVNKQVTLVSLELFPLLYKLCRTKALSETARQILGFLDIHGSASTTFLRKSLGFWGKEGKNTFAKAVVE